MSLTATERGVLEQVHAAIAAQASAIAKPILDQGVTDKTITQAQEDAILTRLSKVPSGPPAPGTQPQRPFDGAPTAAQIALLQQVHTALDAKAQSIAKPILDQAVQDKKITQAQADRLLAMATRRPLGLGGHGLRMGPRAGFGGQGAGYGPPAGFGPPPAA